jgi:hypothetical protein
MEGQDVQDRRSDECGMMSDELKAAFSHSSIIIPHSSFALILPILSIHVNFFIAGTSRAFLVIANTLRR